MIETPRLVLRPLCDEDVGPLWSPDGRQLLFFRVTPEGETPMLTDADGSEPVPLVDVTGVWDHPGDRVVLVP